MSNVNQQGFSVLLLYIYRLKKKVWKLVREKGAKRLNQKAYSDRMKHGEIEVYFTLCACEK